MNTIDWIGFLIFFTGMGVVVGYELRDRLQQWFDRGKADKEQAEKL